jgi:hypothetical protein
MLMNTPVKWNASVSAHLSTLHGKWKEVQKGLQFVLLGYCFLLLMVVPALVLVWHSQRDSKQWLFEKSLGLSPEDGLVIGWGLAGLGTLVGYGSWLAGQWRCLGYAPQRHAAKEVLFASILCLFLGPIALVTAHFLGGADNYVLLTQGLHSLPAQTWGQTGSILQLVGLLLVLGNLLLFSAFLRAVVKCLAPAQSSQLSAYFWFVAFLVGATVGLFWSPRNEVLVCLASGWAICLLWHLALIHVASRSVNTLLPAGNDPQRYDRSHKPKPYSGLHRYYVRLKVD